MLAAMPAVTAFAESPASSDLTNEESVAEGIAAYERELEHGKKYTRFYIRDRENYVQVIGINEVIFADGGSMTFDEFKNAVRSASELS